MEGRLTVQHARIFVPWPGTESNSLQWKRGVPTSGPPGKPQKLFNFYTCFSYSFPVMKMTTKLENISRILYLESWILKWWKAHNIRIWKGSHLLFMGCLTFGPLKAEPRAKIWIQLVYLGSWYAEFLQDFPSKILGLWIWWNMTKITLTLHGKGILQLWVINYLGAC